MYTTDWHSINSSIDYPATQIIWRTPEDNPDNTTTGDLIYEHNNGQHRIQTDVTRNEFETLVNATDSATFHNILGTPSTATLDPLPITADNVTSTDDFETLTLDTTRPVARGFKRWKKRVELDHDLRKTRNQTLNDALFLTAMLNEDDFTAILNQLREEN